jgi:gliotoxin/aspirochlorine/mycotoxins biosynthesis cytochrome P450 monooxygenase
MGPMRPSSICTTPVEQGTISEEELIHTLDEMLFTNLDVTMGGISWNLVFLAANPGVQSRLRQEVKKAKAETSNDAGSFD